MLICNTKTVKLLLSGVFSLIACVSLHATAGESDVIFESGNAVIVGEEHLFVGSASENNKDVLQGQNTQPEISSSDSLKIFIAENAEIYGKEHLVIKQNTPQIFAKNSSKTKSTKTEPTKTSIVKKEPAIIVFPDFPFLPSSASYSYISKESAVTVSQQRLHEYQTASKINRENTFPGIEKSNLSFSPEQRQKFSPAATQCGILTSFSPNSPSLV